MSINNTPNIGPYTELKPFRFWCQKVLPLVYDESLSYYELLCKVVDYLNKTMEDVDQVVIDMGEFKTAYEELIAYVNNYFNNLDVTTEINNKLDAMAEDGTLTLLVKPFFDEAINDIPDIVTDWLDDHVDPETGYVLDNSLTIALAAADAAAVGDRLEPLDDLADAYPKKYTQVAGTLTAEQLVNKWNQVSTPEAYSTLEVDVDEGSTYRLYGYYFGGNFPLAIALSSANAVIDVINGTTTGQNNTVFYTASANVTHLIINTRPAYGAGKCELEGYAKLDVLRGYNYAIVGKDADHYDYTNINTAVVAVGGDKPVEIDFGTYTDFVENLATNKILIGKNPNLCSIVKTNGDYDAPPVEICAGLVENLTLSMENDPLADHMGYALHSDNANTVGATLIIRNCHIYCEGAHAVGMGARSGEKIIFENCIIEQLDSNNDAQAVYIHNSGVGDPTEISFINCQFKAYGYALKLQAWGSGISMVYEFINCTVDSDTYGHSDESIWTDYVSGDVHDTSKLHTFSGIMTLKATSHGNNVNLLNA